jgi:hypothetical protein
MKPVRLVFFLVFTTIFCGYASAQCSQKIHFDKIMSSSTNGTDGKINLKIESSGPYTVQLVELKDTEESVIKSQAGSLSQSMEFDRLRVNSVYKIIVEFQNEEKFFCKKKVITNIRLTEN